MGIGPENSELELADTPTELESCTSTDDWLCLRLDVQDPAGVAGAELERTGAHELVGVPFGVEGVLEGVVGVRTRVPLLEPGPEVLSGFGEFRGVVCKLLLPAGVEDPGLGCGNLGPGGVGIGNCRDVSAGDGSPDAMRGEGKDNELVLGEVG